MIIDIITSTPNGKIWWLPSSMKILHCHGYEYHHHHHHHHHDRNARCDQEAANWRRSLSKSVSASGRRCLFTDDDHNSDDDDDYLNPLNWWLKIEQARRSVPSFCVARCRLVGMRGGSPGLEGGPTHNGPLATLEPPAPIVTLWFQRLHIFSSGFEREENKSKNGPLQASTFYYVSWILSSMEMKYFSKPLLGWSEWLSHWNRGWLGAMHDQLSEI